MTQIFIFSIIKRQNIFQIKQNPVDTGRTLNVHKMFNLRPVSTRKY